MIADHPEASAPTVSIPLLTPGHTFKENGREMIVMKTDAGDIVAVEVVRSIPTDLIDPHPKNRMWCNPAAQSELVENMREHGQSTPGILRPHPTVPGRFQLIAAWRRWNACKELGRPLQAMVRDLDDVQALEQLYLENAQRENLRPLDEAELIDGMLELRDTQGRRVFSLERVAKARYGTDKKGDVLRVAKIHKLLQLPEKLRGPLNEGTLGLQVAFLVARVADPADREKAADDVLRDPITGNPMTVRRTAELISKNYQVNLKGWKEVQRTDLLKEDEKIAMGFTGAVGEAADGSCTRCPFLALNSTVFQDSLAGGRSNQHKAGGGESGIDPMTCTRAGCHRMKLENLWRLEAGAFARSHGLAEESVLGLEASANRHDLVYIDSKPHGTHLNDWDRARDPNLPSWRKVLKGADAPLLVVPDDDGKPVLACETKIAITTGKEKMPEVFAKAVVPGETQPALSVGDIKALVAKRASGDIKEDELKALKAVEEKAEAARIEAAKADMARAVAAETKIDSLKELLEKLTSMGLGIAGAHALVMSVCRELGADFLAFLTGEDTDDIENTYRHAGIEPGLEKHLKGKTFNEMLAIAAVASVWEDVHFSGHDAAEDFQAMCEAVALDTKEIHDRVKKAHQMAFRASEKARRDALDAEAQGRAKNSSEPEDWTADHEASKSAAGDARAKAKDPAFIAGGLLKRMLEDDVPVMEPNEHGVFCEPVSWSFGASKKTGFEVTLAQTLAGGWCTGYSGAAGNGSTSGGPAASRAFARRGGAVYSVVEYLRGWFSNNTGGPKAEEKPREAALRVLEQMARLALERKNEACLAASAAAGVMDKHRAFYLSHQPCNVNLLQEHFGLDYDAALKISDCLVDEKFEGLLTAGATRQDDRVVLLEYCDEKEEGAMIDALLKHEIPVTAPNENGIFIKRAAFVFQATPGVSFSLDLARAAEGAWACGFGFQVFEKQGDDSGEFPSADALCPSRERALAAALDGLYTAWVNATPSRRLHAPWEASRALLARIQGSVAAALGAVPVAGSPATAIDYDKVDIEAAAVAVKADRAAMAVFIGKKPKPNEPERVKKWDALRNKILRKAGLK